MNIAPVWYHYFRVPLPYYQTLVLQEKIHQLQLLQRRTASHRDILLLLQHRPVYTAGRRMNEESTEDERKRLMDIGADFINTNRGGQLTYHGPGQIVGYPLLDISRYSPAMGIRDYICGMQKMLESYLRDNHGLAPVPSDNTGVFLNAASKIASIGVQVRHRLTSHGFSLNITDEPLPWFDRVIACGLVDVKAVSIEAATRQAFSIENEVPALVDFFSQAYGRDVVKLDIGTAGEVGQLISELEDEALVRGSWLKAPSH